MFGIPNTVTDAKGNATAQSLDAFGRYASISVANSSQVDYTYSGSLLSKITRTDIGANLSQVYNFIYDDFGNMTAVQAGSTILASYIYGTNNGPLTQQTYGNNTTVSFTYDDLGRNKTTSYSGGRTLSYAYTGDGQLYSINDSSLGKYVYTYDSLGRLIASQRFNKSNAFVMGTSQTYNDNNQLVGQSWKIGTTAFSETYAYNSTDGSLASMSSASGKTLTYGYDYLRRLSSVNAGVYTRSYTYKNLSDTQTTTQVSRVSYSGLPNNPSYSYTYDALGYIATYTAPDGEVITYTYDAQGQLLKAVGNSTYTYTYDGFGNIKTANDHSYTYDTQWRDLLTAYDGQSITYDASGNPTSYYNGTRWTFEWAEGRNLVEASGGGHTVSYAYDHNGVRTSKTVDGTTHTYYYASGKLLRETYGSNTLDFFYDASGTPFALKHNGTMYYYITNLQGDVMQLVNASGAVVASYEYDPYGNIVSSSGDLASINPLRYRGYYFDQETELYYLQSRYYDPQVGRFINADNTAYLGTDGTVLSYNLFLYCKNNPINSFDPSGTFDWGSLAQGCGWLTTGVAALVVGISVLTCGVAAPAMMAVAAVTAISGAATVVNGASEIGEAFTGYNVVRDAVFQGNETAYNAYAYSTATVAQVGTAVCGNWAANNAPRIEAYNNIQNYKYADGAATHTGQRSYYDSTLLQKQIIKYGNMTNEGNGVYTFRIAGSSFNTTSQKLHVGTWELTTINSMELIGHYLLKY